ncbi:AAA family ATPase [Shinella sp. CPCC 101442]|uniref:NERD domain-containing protein n=1 Tax=Shinella sp. CPCC 101442 TaxID=2932265 RepID=UPI0021528A95|nr:NERD domain-containing protein [Shinella sp. CPCC 101442]MCR6499073.1 AAA family ATPase [Shinella sp. CPCC 101442]
MRRIEPPRHEHGHLRQPLTAGEKIALDFFDKLLPPEWEIYTQPHFNGLRPDFVLLNPDIGIGIYEVKDWNLDAMRYEVREYHKGYKELWATPRDGRSFKVENPFDKIRRYKEAIFNVYCPRLEQKAGFGAINAGLIFPMADSDLVRELQAHFLKDNEKERRAEFWPIVGREELAREMVNTAAPLLERKGKGYMRPELADDLRGWLVEPDFAREQRRPLQLDAAQRNLAETRTSSGYRRIRGPAGSGKSLVLAARAARLIDEGKDVLIVTYNMTLWHYLRDLVVRERKRGKTPGRLTFTHFHEWCGNVCWNSGFANEYVEIMRPITKIKNQNLQPREEARRLRPILPPILNQKVPELALRAAAGAPEDQKYDAILVDEGQDYLPLWWNALRRALREGGEMVLVADTSQDLYGTAKSWTEAAMTRAGFSGAWAKLDVSYRLPTELLSLSQNFAELFLPPDTRIIPQPEQRELGISPCALKWIQCDDQEVVNACLNAVLSIMKLTGPNHGLSNTDITFLCSSHEIGRQVVDRLNGEPWGISSAHTFAESKGEQNRRKMAFFLGRPRVKATTLHSFKGWEARVLVLHLGHAMSPEDMAAAYAAITRLKRDEDGKGSFLTVVCSAPQLSDYGRAWPVFEDRRTFFS